LRSGSATFVPADELRATFVLSSFVPSGNTSVRGRTSVVKRPKSPRLVVYPHNPVVNVCLYLDSKRSGDQICQRTTVRLGNFSTWAEVRRSNLSLPGCCKTGGKNRRFSLQCLGLERMTLPKNRHHIRRL
jgi:hypothetical protein